MFVLTNFNEIKTAFSGAQNLRTWAVTEYYFLMKEINQIFQLNYFKRQPSYFIRTKNYSRWRIQGISRQIQFNPAALLLWKKIQWTIYLRTPTWNWEGHLHALASSTSRRLKSGDLHCLACGSADENGTKLWAPFRCKILTNSKFSQRLRFTTVMKKVLRSQSSIRFESLYIACRNAAHPTYPTSGLFFLLNDGQIWHKCFVTYDLSNP